MLFDITYKVLRIRFICILLLLSNYIDLCSKYNYEWSMRKNNFGFSSQKLSYLACLYLFFSMIFLVAQEKEEGAGEDLSKSLNLVIAEIHKPKFQKTFAGSGGSVDESEMSYKYYESSDEWMEVSFRYSLEDWTEEGGAKLSKEEKKLNPNVPEIGFKIFIEGTSKGTGKQESVSTLLTGEATYVNVKKTDSSSKFRYGIFFVTPELVEQFGLKELFSASKGNIRVEAYIGDKKAVKGKNAEESYKDLKEKDEEWEKVFKTLPQVKHAAITKDMTPWANLSMDRFPILKVKSTEKK